MNAQMDLRIVTLCYGWPQAGSFIDATLAIPRGNPLLLRWDYGVGVADRLPSICACCEGMRRVFGPQRILFHVKYTSDSFDIPSVVSSSLLASLTSIIDFLYFYPLVPT